jgi:YesN/AraC family two-component response regulator
MQYEILVADDHAIIRGGLKKIFADTEDLLVVDEASNGNEALQKVREREYAVAILDMSMPGRNGLDLIKLIKAACTMKNSTQCEPFERAPQGICQKRATAT